MTLTDTDLDALLTAARRLDPELVPVITDAACEGLRRADAARRYSLDPLALTKRFAAVADEAGVRSRFHDLRHPRSL